MVTGGAVIRLVEMIWPFFFSYMYVFGSGPRLLSIYRGFLAYQQRELQPLPMRLCKAWGTCVRCYQLPLVYSVMQEWPLGILTVTQEWPLGILTVMQEWPLGILTVMQEWPLGILTVMQEWPLGILTIMQEWPLGILTVMYTICKQYTVY